MKLGLVAFALTVAATSAVVQASADAKPKKPRLDLRAAPRLAFSPVNVLLTAELIGGDDVEEYHCPELEWEWDDGSKSMHESDCDPLEQGGTIERRYTAEHSYSRAGIYNVKITMRRTNRPLAQASVKITVRPGLGDPTIERE